MARVSPGRTSFNAGEFSFLVEGRTDLDRYPASMRKLRNFISAPQGPAIRRSGTRFYTPTRDETAPTNFLNFEFNETQLYLLEFTNGKMRVLTEDGLVLSGGVPYELNVPYTGNAVKTLYGLQDDDALYIFADGYRVYKLRRFSNTNWSIAPVDFTNGPFIAQPNVAASFSPDGLINPIPPQGQDSTPNGVISANGATNNPAYYLVDGDPATSWVSAAPQSAEIKYVFNTARRITGYSFGAPRGINYDEANENGWTALDHAPSSWVLEKSNDGTNWTILDTKQDYVLYDGGRSAFFEISNDTPATQYRFRITSSRRGSGTRIALSGFTFAEATPTPFDLIGSSMLGINNDQGFKPGDVGRLIRLRGSDNFWRIVRITAVVSLTRVTVVPVGDPLPNGRIIYDWQLGYFADSQGWPTTGAFFGDRMYVAGVASWPNTVFGSAVGDYENMLGRTAADEVLDDNALVLPLKSRKQSRIRWMENDERGLLIGTGVGEWVVSATNDGNITARAVKARSSTERGSAAVTPVKIDRQVLYIQRSKRTVREMAYVYEADGYKSPSMSLFSSHIGVAGFEQLAYAAEPYSIVWVRMGDGRVAGLTYNRDENVVGWHIQDFGGFVEAIATLPSKDGLQDTLWLVVRRIVNGQTRRYIEALQRFWDFDSEIEDAWFVDSGLTYSGAETSSVSGLAHLEGQAVQGLADGVPFEATVQAGAVALRNPASKVTVGLGYNSYGTIARIDAGSANGTSQGKQKRIHKLHALLWSSAYGEIALSTSEFDGAVDFSELPYAEDYSMLEPVALFSGIIGPIDVPRGYDKDCTISFRQTKPLPLNIVSLLPQLDTQDG